jgi:hypothetical protein
MFLNTFNLGHALPLVFTRLSCCARRRAQRREHHAICVGNAATGGSLIAIRNYEPSRQLRHSHFAAKCCVNATRDAALCDSTMLLRL